MTSSTEPPQELQAIFSASNHLSTALQALRGQHDATGIRLLKAALRGEHRHEGLLVLERMQPEYTQELLDEVVEAATAHGEAARARQLLGRLHHQRARRLVPAAVWRLLKREADDDDWRRMAELLDHLGLDDALNELVRQAGNHTHPDVREVAEDYPPSCGLDDDTPHTR